MMSQVESEYFYIVGVPLYGLGFPRRRYVAHYFTCSSSTSGLGNCTYDSSVDPHCFIGPHVAGVRCTQSKSLTVYYTMQVD